MKHYPHPAKADYEILEYFWKSPSNPNADIYPCFIDNYKDDVLIIARDSNHRI